MGREVGGLYAVKLALPACLIISSPHCSSHCLNTSFLHIAEDFVSFPLYIGGLIASIASNRTREKVIEADKKIPDKTASLRKMREKRLSMF